MATQPNRYDVIMTLDLYGDIISEVTAELTGSAGMAGTANIGDRISRFEAIHGSAPDIAGQGFANPSAMLNAPCMMLAHLAMPEKAQSIQNAWLCTWEAGIHPGDVHREDVSKVRAGTKEFAGAMIERLGRVPAYLKSVEVRSGEMPKYTYVRPTVKRELRGVDVFVCDGTSTADQLAERLKKASHGMLKLKMITNRSVKVWPDGSPGTFSTDHWRYRFVDPDALIDDSKATYRIIGQRQVMQMLHLLTEAGVDVITTQNLYLFDGVRGFSLGQGE